MGGGCQRGCIMYKLEHVSMYNRVFQKKNILFLQKLIGETCQSLRLVIKNLVRLYLLSCQCQLHVASVNDQPPPSFSVSYYHQACFEISCHLRFYVILVILVIIVMIVTKVILALMLKVVIEDRCVLKKWPTADSHRALWL